MIQWFNLYKIFVLFILQPGTLKNYFCTTVQKTTPAASKVYKKTAEFTIVIKQKLIFGCYLYASVAYARATLIKQEWKIYLKFQIFWQ